MREKRLVDSIYWWLIRNLLFLFSVKYHYLYYYVKTQIITPSMVAIWCSHHCHVAIYMAVQSMSWCIFFFFFNLSIVHVLYNQYPISTPICNFSSWQIKKFDKYMHQNGKGSFEKALNMINQSSLPILCKHDMQETWAVDKPGYNWQHMQSSACDEIWPIREL